MKFKIRKEELEMALKVIKDSKILIKNDDDISVSSLLIEVDSENQVLRLTVTNYHVWCIINLNQKVFEDYGVDYNTFFVMEESGEVFVNGSEFINIISGYPQSSLINFSSENKDGDVETTYLESFSENKKGKKIKNSFLTKTPQFFEKTPPEEEVSVYKVLSSKLYNAVNMVEFVSGTDEKMKWFWGVQIEVYDDEIATMATDKRRICYYDIRGEEREELDKAVIFTPIKLPLISALKNLKMSDPVEIRVGQKKTTLIQDWQMHVIPNVVFSNNKMPDWRAFVKNLNEDEERVNINLPRKTIEDCVKRALLTSGGYYGIKISFNTDDKEVEFSIQRVEDSGLVQSRYSETEPLEEGQCSSDINDTVILTIDSLKDIISKSKGEMITFRVKDSVSPIQILNAEDNFGYVASTVKYQ